MMSTSIAGYGQAFVVSDNQRNHGLNTGTQGFIASRIWILRYTMRGGLKFGGDFSVYPGDPELYHAIFSLRVVHRDLALKSTWLAGAARGVHSTRKHFVLGYVDDEEEMDRTRKVMVKW